MLSALAIPGFLSAPAVPAQTLAQQWQGLFARGKVLGPQLAVASLLGYGYLAYQRKTATGPDRQGWAGYVAAAALAISIVPFTIVFMNPTNIALQNVAFGTDKTTSETAVRELLVKWKGLNLVRSFFPLAGAILGFWTLVA